MNNTLSKVDDPIFDGLLLLCALLNQSITKCQLTEGMSVDTENLLQRIPKMLDRAQLSARVVRFKLLDMEPALLPALLLLSDGRALVLVQCDRYDAVLADPLSGGGQQVMTMQVLAERYSGIAVFAKPKINLDTRANAMVNEKPENWFKTPLLRLWKVYSSISVATLVANLLAVSISLFAMQVYDRVVPNAAFDTLWILASGVALALLLEFIIKISRTHILDTVGKKLDLELSSKLFNQLLNMRLQNKPGSVGAFSNQIREFESVREFMTSSTVSAISDLPFVLMFLLVIYFIGGDLALVPALGMVLILIPSLVAQGFLSKFSRANLREAAIKNGVLLEAIDNLQSVKAFRAEGRLLHKWEQLTASLAAGEIKNRSITATLSHLSAMLQQLSYVGLIAYGVYLINDGLLTVGGLIACSILSSRAVAPVGNVAGMLGRWQHVKLALDGLNNFMARPTERPLGKQFSGKRHLVGDIEIHQMQYAYTENSKTELDIEQLKIASGSKVAVLGINGAGKSTLLKLLSGLISPSNGTITIDNLNLNHIDPTDVRRSVGYLPQENVIFYGTLRENLCLANNLHSDEEIFEVLEGVGLGDFVRNHDFGLDMLLEGSGSVSGGQKQAICLARLILLNPSIVLLDEPTSAYDLTSELKVLAYLKQWLNNKTLILCTHKKSMLELTDRVIVLKDGKLSMDGATDKLVKGNKVKHAEDTI